MEDLDWVPGFCLWLGLSLAVAANEGKLEDGSVCVSQSVCLSLFFPACSSTIFGTLPFNTIIPYQSMVQLLPTLLVIQHPTNVPVKAVENGF